MNVPTLTMPKEEAAEALRSYKEHRATYDARDWEIERIFRAIARGKTVISVTDSIVSAGLDEKGRPRLAFARADVASVFCYLEQDSIEFRKTRWQRNTWKFRMDWPGMRHGINLLKADAPRIPPQHRPDQKHLADYDILWEADWTDVPRDPYLLKQIGKDAWIVLAAWELTDVELSVIRAHSGDRK